MTALPGFEASTFQHDGRSYEVFKGGSGPAVVVLHEIPGIHPGVIEFAKRLEREGFTVYMPSLFGEPGAAATARSANLAVARLCISREFAFFTDRTSRVVPWLRALAAKAHSECGGPGVGAIGMCFSGGFALAMAVEPAVLAPVMSQPALPAPFPASNRAALGLDEDDLRAIKDRDIGVMALRFTGDRNCPAERFETLRREFGDRFVGIEIDSSPGNAAGLPKHAHAVLTLELSEEEGHPTKAALDRVIAFLGERLNPG